MRYDIYHWYTKGLVYSGEQARLAVDPKTNRIIAVCGLGAAEENEVYGRHAPMYFIGKNPTEIGAVKQKYSESDISQWWTE